MIKLSEQQGRLVAEAIMAMGTEVLPEFGAIADQILDQLDHPGHQTELIDTIAGLIMMKTSRTAISTAVLQALQKAVLNPKELATVKAAVRNGMICARCDRQMMEGEAMTLVGQDAYCWGCVKPTMLYCSGCQGHMTMPNGFSRLFTKEIKACGRCKVKAEQTAEEIRPQDQRRPEFTPVAPPPIGAEEARPRTRMTLREAAEQIRRDGAEQMRREATTEWVTMPMNAAPPQHVVTWTPDNLVLEREMFTQPPDQFERDLENLRRIIDNTPQPTGVAFDTPTLRGPDENL
jgi:hypothetical protein